MSVSVSPVGDQPSTEPTCSAKATMIPAGPRPSSHFISQLEVQSQGIAPVVAQARDRGVNVIDGEHDPVQTQGVGRRDCWVRSHRRPAAP
jgi:hypothetical protein